MADRVNKISESSIKHQGRKYIDEHVLVCLSSSPSNEKIIRTAWRISRAYKCKFSAVYVETPWAKDMSSEDAERLERNSKLAENLGANMETVYGDDIAQQISEFSRLAGVSKIVIGRSHTKKKLFFKKNSFVDRLLLEDLDLDIYIIPDKDTPTYTKNSRKNREKNKFKPSDILITFGILVLTTVIGKVFESLNLEITNIIIVYLLGVLFSTVLTTKRIYSIILSFVNVLAYNFFFIDPVYTLSVNDPKYAVTFIIMLVGALLSGSLTNRIKQQAKLSAKTVYRTSVLLEANELIQQEKSDLGIVNVIAKQLMKILNRDIVVYLSDGEKLKTPITFGADGKEKADDLCLSVNERAVADWVFKNNKRAGSETGTLNSARCIYYAIRGSEGIYGVIGLDVSEYHLENDENNLFHALISVLGVSLEKEQLIRKNNEAMLEMKNEQLKYNLLRGISHDLRTPLTSISGNADMLMKNSLKFSEEKKQDIYTDIYDDSIWLINLIENILSVTKIEDGSMKLNIEPEVFEEVIDEALRHIDRRKTEHTIEKDFSSDIIIVKMDAKLIMQVITNLLDNAIKYTQVGSEIVVRLYKNKNKVVFEVSDNGEGISDANKKRVFDKYFTSDHGTSDSRRGFGLGLPLCKSIIEAHGGHIEVLDNKPKGTIFRFSLNMEEVKLHG